MQEPLARAARFQTAFPPEFDARAQALSLEAWHSMPPSQRKRLDA